MSDDDNNKPESMDINEPQNFEQLAKDASEKLGVDIDVMREITPEEILYLLDHCPFLQIVNLEVGLGNEEVSLVKADSGWVIHDYGDALSSSPGRLLFGGGYILSGDEDEEGGGGSGLVEGKGTVHKQAFDTAMQMVEIAHRHGWPGFHTIDGHPMMMRAAWIMAGKLGLQVTGFEPSVHDEQVRERFDLSETEIEALKQKVRSNKTP